MYDETRNAWTIKFFRELENLILIILILISVHILEMLYVNGTVLFDLLVYLCSVSYKKGIHNLLQALSSS